MFVVLTLKIVLIILKKILCITINNKNGMFLNT